MIGHGLAAIALAQAASAAVPAVEARRLPAAEANQGVAVGCEHFYAIANDRIGKYDKRSGKRLAAWAGDPKLFVHMNSCALAGAQLICAASNYPAVPMSSSVEYFDARSLRHVATRSLGPGIGSLTWLDFHRGSWWAGFANYDGKGGEPGRNHRWTTIVRYDERFNRQEAWLLPEAVLARMAPYSNSGGAWGEDGLLYLTGHDRPEVYTMRIPAAGSVLEHVATYSTASAGQAIDWDPEVPNRLWSIDRKRRELVATDLPLKR